MKQMGLETTSNVFFAYTLWGTDQYVDVEFFRQEDIPPYEMFLLKLVSKLDEKTNTFGSITLSFL